MGDVYAVLPNTASSASTVLLNDMGSSLSVSAVNGNAAFIGQTTQLPSGAMLTMNADGTFAFTPAPNSTLDSFTYTATDGVDSDTTTVSINVDGNPPPPPPSGLSAQADSYFLIHDQTLTATADGSSGVHGVLHNDTGINLTVSAVNGNAMAIGQTVTLPSGAQVTMQANGAFGFIPAAHTMGTETFSYTLTDGTQTATVQVTFYVTDHTPSVMDGFYEVSSSQTTSIAADSGVLSTAIDPEDSLTAILLPGAATRYAGS